ncbi:hypothetical protein Tco_0292111 [Tanacetum coccineum]
MISYLKNMEGWKHKALKSKDFDSIKELFDKAFTRVNMFVDFRTELVEDEEEVTIDAVPLATKSPSIVDWKIHKEGKKSYYQIVRAVGKSQMYRVFSQILKSFTREDLKDLYKLVKAKYGSTRPVEDLDLTAGEVTTASTKLLLLEKVTTARGINAVEGVNAASEEVSTTELLKEFDLLKWDQQECTYIVFLKCQPLNFKGTEVVIGLTQWFEKMKSVFHISKCTVACQNKFATCTLLDSALTWWNSHVKTVGHNVTYGMRWKTLKKMMTTKYCLRSKIKKMFLEESDEVEKYVGGFPDMIQGSMMASKPKTMQDAIEFATELMDQKIRTFIDRQAKQKKA